MTRYLMGWLRSVLDQPGVPAGDHGSLRHAVMANLIQVEDVCDRNDRWLPPNDRETIAKSMEDALLSLNALCSTALAANKLFWHIARTVLTKYHGGV